jgi:DNA-nicking Smr family endonuclease
MKPKADVGSAPLPDFQIGQKAKIASAHDLLGPIAERVSAAQVNMDSRAHRRMTRGKLKPEARIDLHGMTVAEAHPELTAFILGSQAVGRRLVLVITGKGKDRDDGGPIPVRQGVLRHQVPQWLALPPLAQAVLQVTPAHIRHGGHGAYYVYLRRNR